MSGLFNALYKSSMIFLASVVLVDLIQSAQRKNAEKDAGKTPWRAGY